MIGFLISLAPFIPAMLEIAGFFINMFGTSKANLQAYADMIQKNKDSGLITVETYQKLVDFHKQMMDEYAADEVAKQTKDVPKSPPV